MSWNFCNDDIKFVNIADRSAVKISKEEFKSKIKKYMGFEEKEDDWYEKKCLETFVKDIFYNPPVKEDLTINIGKDIMFLDESLNTMFGIQTLNNGLTFLGGLIRGTNELSEVYFCIYYNGKTFRLYIPIYGNAFNKIAKCSFGMERDLNTIGFEKYKNTVNRWLNNHDIYELIEDIEEDNTKSKNEILELCEDVFTNPHVYTKILGNKVNIFDKINYKAIRKDLSITIAVY